MGLEHHGLPILLHPFPSNKRAKHHPSRRYPHTGPLIVLPRCRSTCPMPPTNGWRQCDSGGRNGGVLFVDRLIYTTCFRSIWRYSQGHMTTIQYPDCLEDIPTLIRYGLQFEVEMFLWAYSTNMDATQTTESYKNICTKTTSTSKTLTINHAHSNKWCHFQRKAAMCSHAGLVVDLFETYFFFWHLATYYIVPTVKTGQYRHTISYNIIQHHNMHKPIDNPIKPPGVVLSRALARNGRKTLRKISWQNMRTPWGPRFTVKLLVYTSFPPGEWRRDGLHWPKMDGWRGRLPWSPKV